RRWRCRSPPAPRRSRPPRPAPATPPSGGVVPSWADPACSRQPCGTSETSRTTLFAWLSPTVPGAQRACVDRHDVVMTGTNWDWEDRAEEYAAEALAAGSPTAWFDRTYAAGRRGEVSVPWDKDQANPLLVE